MVNPPAADPDFPRIFQINISDGGVPKLPVGHAVIDFSGAQGDRQRNLKHHGGPDRALCLFSLERILALQQEGHAIVPGATGENLTVVGLDWNTARPSLSQCAGLCSGD